MVIPTIFQVWLVNSPDLNSIDYKTWSINQQRVQSTTVQDVKDLMQHLMMRGLEWKLLCPHP